MSDLSAKIHDTVGPTSAPIRILLINPNSTVAFTRDLATYLATTVPPDVRVDLYTAPSAAPPSIDGTEHGVQSTNAIVDDLRVGSEQSTQWLMQYSGVVVACFSMHPLTEVLRRQFAGKKEKTPAVLGIMESAILGAMSLGPKFGIATTGEQWEQLFDDAMPVLGIASSRYAGTKGTGFNAISLHGQGAVDALLDASAWLVKEKGADVVVLGCGGMAPMRASLEETLAEKVGWRVPIVDGVQVAVDMGVGYARMGVSRMF